MNLIDRFSDAFAQAQSWLFEAAVQPIVFGLGLGGFVEKAFNGTMWLMVGLMQLLVLVAVLVPLQRRFAVEPVTDKAAVRTDVIYTLIHRLGVFRVAMFLSVDPIIDSVLGSLRVAGMPTWHIDSIWPGVTDVAWVSLIVYMLVFDFVDYWIHRGQHRWQWWWGLHALHHSQRQMTAWTDNRTHLLDSLLRDVILVSVGQAVGVGPGQFVFIVAVTQLIENLEHANLRWSFGVVGERLLVSPRFHRLHHAIGIGHEKQLPDGSTRHLGGCNYAVLFPVWDSLFGTAQLRAQPLRTHRHT
jgi:sterol desaturase/sphingolipid hydroxylase (fatty acid hydroxylase superfamily)